MNSKSPAESEDESPKSPKDAGIPTERPGSGMVGKYEEAGKYWEIFGNIGMIAANIKVYRF